MCLIVLKIKLPKNKKVRGKLSHIKGNEKEVTDFLVKTIELKESQCQPLNKTILTAFLILKLVYII